MMSTHTHLHAIHLKCLVNAKYDKTCKKDRSHLSRLSSSLVIFFYYYFNSRLSCNCWRTVFSCQYSNAIRMRTTSKISVDFHVSSRTGRTTNVAEPPEVGVTNASHPLPKHNSVDFLPQLGTASIVEIFEDTCPAGFKSCTNSRDKYLISHRDHWSAAVLLAYLSGSILPFADRRERENIFPYPLTNNNKLDRVERTHWSSVQAGQLVVFDFDADNRGLSFVPSSFIPVCISPLRRLHP